MKVQGKIKEQAIEIAQESSVNNLVKFKSEHQKELSKKQLIFALAAAKLIDKFIDVTSLHKHKNKKNLAELKFVEAYNNNAFPDIFEIIGERKITTFRNWKTKYLRANKDYRILAPNYKIKKSSSITPQESEVLVRLLLHPGKPLTSEVIRQAVNYFEAKRFIHIKSYNTYKKFIDDWIKENYADYIFYREGEKGLDDKVLPYIERDWSMVEVGDIIIMDGHVNNYEIINPFTGKPKRMITVGAIDGRSQYLCGYEIAITENVLTIASALRRAILQLGKIPKVVYIDNGKAFTAKYFHGDDVGNLEPLFARLGIKTIFAKTYHAQSKIIEPFWDWMAELERLIPTYVGTSIEMQPPRLHRGEFLHRKLYEKAMQNTTIDIYAAHKAMAWWLDQYHSRTKQSGHLKGMTPAQIFDAGKHNGEEILLTDGKTTINRNELNFLMMDTHVTTLYRKGLKIFGEWYWNDALFGKQIDAGDDVTIKYDLFDKDAILVYDKEGNFVCEAKNVKKIHPAADLLGLPEHQKEFKNQIAHKEHLKSSVIGEAKKFAVEEIFPFVKKQLSDANILQLSEADDSTDTNSAKTKLQKGGTNNKKKKNTIGRLKMPEEKNNNHINSYREIRFK